MSRTTFTVEQVLSMLSGAPSRIATATANLSADQLRTAPAPGEWSANEVLAHMRSCADVWGSCAKQIAQGAKTLRAINPRTWIKGTDYLELEFRPSFDAYTVQRTELLAMLRSLPQDVWSRSATVTGAGKLLERTVFFYAQWLARHERPHIKQIEQIAKTMQNKKVGNK